MSITSTPTATSSQVCYREDQYFSRWIVVILVIVFSVTGASLMIFPRKGAATEPWWVVPAALAGELLFVLCFAALKIVTEVNQDGVFVRLYPFPSKFYSFGQIAQAAVRTYSPLLEYGGWGIRYTLSHGWAWNARGNRGVQLELVSGSKVLIGSQQPEDLERAIAAGRET